MCKQNTGMHAATCDPVVQFFPSQDLFYCSPKIGVESHQKSICPIRFSLAMLYDALGQGTFGGPWQGPLAKNANRV